MKRVFVLGDLHGDFRKLHRYLNNGVIDRSLVIQVGDFFGFPTFSEERWYENLESLNAKLEEHECDLWAIRGNHEDPTFWSNADKRKKFELQHPNIKLIPDYTSHWINGKKFTFVGGAISIDRHVRKEGESWWKDEVLEPIPEDLEECDVLIMHTAPSWFNKHPKDLSSPLMQWATDNDDDLLDDIVEERLQADCIMDATKPRFIYGGHFHNSSRDFRGNTSYQCLNINELDKIMFDRL